MVDMSIGTKQQKNIAGLPCSIDYFLPNAGQSVMSDLQLDSIKVVVGKYSVQLIDQFWYGKASMARNSEYTMGHYLICIVKRHKSI